MKYPLSLLAFIALTPLVYATPDLSAGHRGPTPYDRYMRPVRRVLQQLNGPSPDFRRVSELLRTGYQFDYVYESPYVSATPEMTAARHAGDCKAKSLWLAKAMNDPSILFLIGKARATSELSHAWLMWKNNGRWWILDPTKAPRPIEADRVPQNEYQVSYAYDRHGSYVYVKPARFDRGVAGHD